MPRTDRRPLLRLDRLEDRAVPAVAVWDGGGADSKWTTAANWQNDVAPQAGDDLVFPAGAQQLASVNDFAAGTTFGSLSVTGSGYSIRGNALAVSKGVSANIPSGGTSTLALSVGGAGGLVKDGFGSLELTGENSYAGLTDLRLGLLGARTATALGAAGAGNETHVAAAAVLSVGATGPGTAPIAVPEAITFSGRTAQNQNPLLIPGSTSVTLGGPITLTGPADAPTRFAVLLDASVNPAGFLHIAGGVSEVGGPLGLELYTDGSLNVGDQPGYLVTGTTAVTGSGSVIFNQATAGPVRVSGGAHLVGPGHYGAVTVADGGVFGGIVAVSGALTADSLTQDPGGVLRVHFGLGGGPVRVFGTVSLSGRLTVEKDASVYSNQPDLPYTVIDNQGTGPVQGTFAGLPEGSVAGGINGMPLRVTYRGGDGNDVELVPDPASALRSAVGAGPGGEPRVNVYDGSGNLVRSFNAYDPAFRGGVHVASGDVTGDGVPDVVTGPGPGGGPHVKVFDGVTGALVREFNAYDPSFTGGVFVATGRMGDNGYKDIITGAGAGGGPHVEVFDGHDGSLVSSFYAYDPAFTGGVSVAGLDGNAVAIAHFFRPLTVVTGAGPGGGPHVRTFDGRTGQGLTDFMAYDPSFRGGVNVAAGAGAAVSVADPAFTVVTAPASGGGPDVRVYTTTGTLQASFLAYDPGFTGGVTVAAVPVTASGTKAILTGAGPGGGPHVELWELSGTAASRDRSFLAFDPAFTGGVFVG